MDKSELSNSYITRDEQVVNWTGRVLVLIAGLHFASMAVEFNTGVALFGSIYLILGMATIAGHAVAIGGGIFMAGIATLYFFGEQNYLPLAVNLATFVGLILAQRQVGRINRRITAEEQDNPMTAYYHALVPILVRVMKADGHVDKREKKKIKQLCAGMHLSRYEINFILGRAEKNEKPLDQLVKEYFTTAQAVGKASDVQLLMSVLAVASADGLIVDEEIEVVRQVGRHAGMPDGVIEGFVEQQKKKLDDLSSDIIYKILGVEPSADESEVKKAYENLVVDLQGANYKHISDDMVQYIDDRRQILEKAYQAATTGSSEDRTDDGDGQNQG